MKKVGVLGFLAAFAVVLNVLDLNFASARPQYRTRFMEVFEESKIADAAKEAKCNVCHYGKSKKNRNDFGKALSKHLTKDIYMELRRDREALYKKVTESLKAVLKQKSVNGKTFGERIKAGKLPGTAPEEAAAEEE